MLSGLSALLELVSVVPVSPVRVPLLFLQTAIAWMCAAYARAKAAIPATTAATLLPTATTFAAPLKVVGVAVVEDVDEEDEDVVVTLDAVAAGVVELPAGKGTGATVGMVAKAVEDVAGVEAATGVADVTRVLVEELEVELELDEAIEAEPPTGPALPVQG